MKKVKSTLLIILVSAVVVYYAGEMIAFANSVKWHNSNHPLTFVSVKDGKAVVVNGIKIGDYYLDNIFRQDFYLETNLEDKANCSICKGKKDKPFLIKLIWSWSGINENKNLAKR